MTYLKLAVDVIMAVVFVLLLNKRALGGLPFHEIAGTAIVIAFLTHILLNWQWVVGVSTRFLAPKLAGKTRLNYLLDWLLLLAMTFVMVSGILVSKVLFPGIYIANKRWFTGAHISVSFLILAIVGVHVGLHWSWVVSVVKRILNRFLVFRPSWHISSAIFVPALLLFAGYEAHQTNYLAKLGLIRNVIQGPAQDGVRGTVRRREEPGRDPERWRDGSRGEPRREEGHQSRSASAWKVLLSYLGVMGLFVIVTHYVEKWLSRRPFRVLQHARL